MATRPKVIGENAMASRWRRRATCVLVGDCPLPVALHAVSGRGAELVTAARPPLGGSVELHHPEAGMIRARIVGHRADGIALAFDPSPAAVAFALAVTTADMSRPA